ncbi:MAG TPA: hypothetical protein VIL74_08975 [Pyrinomonadaceae bacterium]|jgi:hypothetical protein
MKENIETLFGVASVIASAAFGVERPSYFSKRPQPKASPDIKLRCLEKAQAKRDARNARVAERMFKGSHIHKFKGNRFGLPSYAQ